MRQKSIFHGRQTCGNGFLVRCSSFLHSSPSFDIVEYHHFYQYILDVPSVRMMNLKISYQNHSILVEGYRNQKYEGCVDVLVHKRLNGYFCYRIPYNPNAMDIRHATASFSNGVLYISLRKLECLSSFSNPSFMQCLFIIALSWSRSLFSIMEDNKEIDYFAYSVPYKSLDITIISTRFPYSRKRVESMLASTHTDGSLGSQAISAWIIKPISLLEECAFILDYVHILTESNYESLNQKDRFEVVLRYVLSWFSIISTSIYFPCVPYLGETFACFVTCGSRRIQYIAEQCTLHPNTSAFYAEDDAKEFQIEGTIQPKYFFCGNIIRCMLLGSITIHHKCGDSYSLTMPSICITSLRHGSPEVQLCGKCRLTSNTNYNAGFEFIERSPLGGDAKCVRILVYEKDKVICRLQGRWDIGYEIFGDSSQSPKEFLSIQTLKANHRFVLRYDLQGPMESLQVWKTLRQEMIGGSDCEVAQRILIKLEMKKKLYLKQMEKLPHFSLTDRFLFTQIENQLGFRFKLRDKNLCFLEVSRNVDNGIKKAEDIHTLLNVSCVC